MTRQEESIKQRTFAILWDKARDDRHRSLRAESSMVWLKDEGWPLLFPGHCFTCHMNEHDRCKTDGHLSCPACWEQVKPKPLSTVCVCGHTKNWHTHGRGSSCQVGPDTSPAKKYCPCPEFFEGKGVDLTRSGTVTDCVGGAIKGMHDAIEENKKLRGDLEAVTSVEVWPLTRVLSEIRCGSQEWTWEEEWADLDRRHTETGYLDRLEQQIQANGITMPVLIGSDGRLWDGHHRLRIAVRTGIPYVPVEVVRTKQDTARDIDLTHSGTVTDCVGGPCGCKEGAHE